MAVVLTPWKAACLLLGVFLYICPEKCCLVQGALLNGVAAL